MNHALHPFVACECARVAQKRGASPDVASRSRGDDRAPSRRRIRAEGPAAARWFASQGLTPQPPPPATDAPVLMVDELIHGSFAVRRIRHTAVTLSSVGGEDPQNSCSSSTHPSISLTLQTEGESVVSSPDGVRTLHAHDALLATTHSVQSFMTRSPSARIEMISSSLRLPPSHFTHLARTRDSSASVAIVSIVNAILDEGDEVNSCTGSAVQRALENLVEALLCEAAVPKRRGQRRAAAELFCAANEYIALSAHDASVGVESVAEATNVSVQYLRRVFAARGTSPSSEIRRRRCQLARILLAAGVDDPLEICAHSGFPSVRALHRALATFDAEDAHPRATLTG